ncbi:MAG: chromate transporter [Clostridia bacterium]|nr:chromate transporter [Clostridia bacterium]
MKRLLSSLSLMLKMMKIGLFTFGGGYAMIGLLHSEFVERKNYLSHDEFMDVVAVAESTPGPIAINMSTYVGYKRAGFLGALLSTIGMCMPSFVIIFLISLFFDRFLEITWVYSAFRGIQVCVIFLILSAGFKMLKQLKGTLVNTIILCVTIFFMVLFSFTGVSFSAILYILISGLVGLIIFMVKYIKEKNEEGKK